MDQGRSDHVAHHQGNPVVPRACPRHPHPATGRSLSLRAAVSVMRLRREKSAAAPRAALIADFSVFSGLDGPGGVGAIVHSAMGHGRRERRGRAARHRTFLSTCAAQLPPPCALLSPTALVTLPSPPFSTTPTAPFLTAPFTQTPTPQTGLQLATVFDMFDAPPKGMFSASIDYLRGVKILGIRRTVRGCCPPLRTQSDLSPLRGVCVCAAWN